VTKSHFLCSLFHVSTHNVIRFKRKWAICDDFYDRWDPSFTVDLFLLRKTYAIFTQEKVFIFYAIRINPIKQINAICWRWNWNEKEVNEWEKRFHVTIITKKSNQARYMCINIAFVRGIRYQNKKKLYI
jgi:hypothetical protein